jgi:hypothetical protein
MTQQIQITARLPESQAAALAQFVKRVDRDTARRHAGDDEEADEIYEAFMALRAGLAEAGYAPR